MTGDAGQAYRARHAGFAAPGHGLRKDGFRFAPPARSSGPTASLFKAETTVEREHQPVCRASSTASAIRTGWVGAAPAVIDFGPR